MFWGVLQYPHPALKIQIIPSDSTCFIQTLHHQPHSLATTILMAGIHTYHTHLTPGIRALCPVSLTRLSGHTNTFVRAY